MGDWKGLPDHDRTGERLSHRHERRPENEFTEKKLPGPGDEVVDTRDQYQTFDLSVRLTVQCKAVGVRECKAVGVGMDGQSEYQEAGLTVHLDATWHADGADMYIQPWAYVGMTPPNTVSLGLPLQADIGGVRGGLSLGGSSSQSPSSRSVHQGAYVYRCVPRVILLGAK